jgi:hypothetical protein
MSTSSEKETEVHKTTDPWAPQAAALQTAFNGAGGALSQASGATAPTDFTAQMDPAAIAAFKQMVAQGGNLSVPNAQAATGEALMGAGTSGVQGALTGLGGYNAANTNNTQTQIDAANKYVAGQDVDAQVRNAMLQATQTARDVTLPGINQNAAAGGNVNSSRTGIAEGMVQRGLAQQSADLGSTLRNKAFSDGLALSNNTNQANNQQNLGALAAQGQIGNQAAGTGVSAGTQSVANQGALTSEMAAGGAGLTAAQQAILDNQQQQYQSKVSAPFDPLKQYMSVVGSNNWGSATNGTETETKTPSAWDTISGLMSSAGSAAQGGAKLMAFSDRRVKEDITRIGTLDNGLPLYTFRYIGEARLNVGLMAQDVELVNPDAVSDFHGIKVVDYALACR